MIKLGYHNDGKEKYQSHEIVMMEDDFYNHKFEVYSHNPFDVCGYGETKEEALDDFIRKFKYIMDELRAFETLLLDTNVIIDNIVDVDCFGKEIKNK